MAQRRARSAPKHVVVGVADRLQRRPPAFGKGRDGQAKGAGHQPGQRRAAVQVCLGAVDLERHQLSELGRGHGQPKILGSAVEALQVLARNVDAAVGVVLGDVLPVLDKLQAGADLVRQPDALGRGRVEDMEDEAAHGIGRKLAVAGEFLDRFVGMDGLVLAVGPDEATERLVGDVGGADGGDQSTHDRMRRHPLGVDGRHLVVQPIQQGQPIALGRVANSSTSRANP